MKLYNSVQLCQIRGYYSGVAKVSVLLWWRWLVVDILKIRNVFIFVSVEVRGLTRLLAPSSNSRL